MRTITETTKITRVETNGGHFLDFDMEGYDVERRIYEWVSEMHEAGRYPRVFEGTVVVELKEVEY